MKRRFLAAVAALIMAVFLAFGASACGKVYVADAEINSLGELILTYSDGTVTNLGSVRGSDGTVGKDGQDGEDGVGIKDVYIDKNGHLIVELTDGTVKDCGAFGSALEGGNVVSGDLLFSVTEENGEVIGYNVAGLNRPSATNINVPSKVNGLPVTGIAANAFYECEGIVSVTLPDTVRKIGELAFYHCISLESVEFGNGLEIIDEYAFNECFALKSVTLPKSVKSIGECAFVYCQSLETLVLNDGLTSIGDCAFGGCASLKNFNMPDSVTSIGWGMLMFGGGAGFGGEGSTENNISGIKISAGIKEIAEFAFSGCSVKSLRLGDSVETVGYSAFYGCGALESVIIPKSVKRIVSFAFYQCPALNAVYYEGTEAEWKNVVVGRSNDISSDGAVKYFYSEARPTAEGNFWHYVQGEPAKW